MKLKERLKIRKGQYEFRKAVTCLVTGTKECLAVEEGRKFLVVQLCSSENKIRTHKNVSVDDLWHNF